MKTKLMPYSLSFAAAFVTLLAYAAPSPAQNVDLSGTWTLNRQVSDSLGKTRAARDENGRRMPGRRPGTGRGGIPGVGAEFPQGDPNAGNIAAQGENMRNIMDVIDQWNEGNERLVISAAGKGIRVAYSDSTILILAADGAKRKFPIRDFEAIQAKSEWKDGKLVANYKINGVSVQETYERGIDSPRLIVTTQVPGAMRPITFRRVYDASQ